MYTHVASDSAEPWSLSAEDSEEEALQLSSRWQRPRRMTVAVVTVLFALSACGWLAAKGHATSLQPEINTQSIINEMQKGDLVTSASEFPFVLFQFLGSSPTNMICGGTLIADRWVLTAGHCRRPKLLNWKVRIHVTDYRKPLDEEGAIEREVKAAHMHADYNKGPPDDWYYDIMVLELDRPVENVKPVALDDGSIDIAKGTTQGVVLGWGSTDASCEKKDPRLKRHNVTILSDAQCQHWAYITDLSSRTGIYSDPRYNICGGEKVKRYPWGETGCADCGGPLLVKSQGQWHQVGVLSYANDYTMGQFIRVSAFLDWIKNITGTLQHRQPQGWNPDPQQPRGWNQR